MASPTGHESALNDLATQHIVDKNTENSPCWLIHGKISGYP
jgi:hypothetical protein